MLKKLIILIAFCVIVVAAISCENVYKPGETNPFIIDDPNPVSGNINNEDDRYELDLNPILISGEPVTDLPDDSFWIWIGDDDDETTYTPVEDPTVSPGVEQPIDLAIILDNTSSMGPAIEGIKNSLTSFSASLESAGIDVSFGLVTFGDSALHPTPTGPIPSEGGNTDCELKPRPIKDFGTAAELLTVLTNDVTHEGGGDAPENTLDAILWGYNNLTWRTGSLKVFLVITDNQVHQLGDGSSDDYCTTTIDSVYSTLSGRAMVHTISKDYFYSFFPLGDIRQLADGLGEGRTTPLANTGGKWIEFPSDGNVDLSALGLDSILSAGYTVVFDLDDPDRPLYILIQIDTDGDGVPDTETTFVLTS